MGTALSTTSQGGSKGEEDAELRRSSWQVLNGDAIKPPWLPKPTSKRDRHGATSRPRTTSLHPRVPKRHSYRLICPPKLVKETRTLLVGAHIVPCIHAYRPVSSPVPCVAAAAASVASSTAARHVCGGFRSPTGSVVPISCGNRRRARPSEVQKCTYHITGRTKT